ncbi:hypothetical protein [uncultured Tyzzerella sp.]|uniref:hypothetical protein n=1 Tax=uncultured Tyzzerella sp. TaxID=2321398 RepID=UPI0029428B03|nr:hypothetical protein [uncultured Tyzzerella sp.]
MDYNKLFQQEAFKSIDKNILEKFKMLIENIKGKNTNDIMIQIMSFYNSIPKGANLSKEESNALIQTIILNMDNKERENFLNMLDLINS